MRALLITLLMTIATQATAQGVRDSCPSGECGGGDISYIVPVIFLLMAAGALFSIFYGSKKEKRNGTLFFLRTFKAALIFACIPFLIGYVIDPMYGVYSFFALFFVPGLVKWIVGEEDEE